MILLDTNVVFEPIRRHPDSRMLDWLDAQVIESLHLSTISLAKLLLGAESLPAGSGGLRSRLRWSSKSQACSAIASFRSTSPPPRPMRRSSSGRGAKDTRFRSQMVKSRGLRPLTDCASPRAMSCHFALPALS